MSYYFKRKSNIYFFTVFCLILFSDFSCVKSKLQLTRITPGEIVWQKNSEPDKIETIAISGDPNKRSYYTIRVRIPEGMKIQPHYHPEERMVTVISGTLFVGYGSVFDENQLKELPPGSFFTEPGDQPHFVCARDGEVIVQATGVGPTKTTYVKEKNEKNKY